MQRKPGFPAVNCNIKVPDSSITTESVADDEWEPQHRRQQLINFGHTQWGFNNWNWAVTKQDLDFVELVNGKYTAGVAAFVSVSVKNLDIHRENVGYATSVGVTKGSAIHRARKCAVTNALRETLLSFGGNVATELLELVETKPEVPTPAPVEYQENNQNVANRQPEIKNSPRKDDVPSNVNVPHRVMPTAPLLKNATPNPPIATAHPMPANLPPAANRPPLAANVQRPPQQAIRPNSNVANEEEARAERKRRQRQAQEEFRLKQLMKDKETDLNELDKNVSFDSILLAVPTQVVIGVADKEASVGKRSSPGPDGNAKRRAT
ncbi:DNA repair protein RAD52 homolog isoform X2 [Leptidea sinapis]|uniref:DNA repair protein RAD52 homolog isoform X2 n=1 Tax=Leptidea sinapis TaxID=189913 RepID=UPI002126CA23|nr:DNA repair protein RAD52 homolog isoform X2 [Leptidea sinapis]